METTLSPRRRPLRASPTLNLASAGIALVATCYGLARFGYGFFTPIFRAEFNLSPASIGFFASASYFAYCLAILAGTTLTSRFGARRLVICSGMLAAVAMALIAIAPNTTALGLGVAATGLCTGLVSPPLATVIAENVAVTYQHRVQTMVNSGAGIGIIISVPVALAASTQWRTAWLLFAAVALLSTLWIAKATPKPPARRNPGLPGGQATSLERFLPSPLLPPGALRLLLAAAGLGAMSTAVLNFGIDFMVQAGGQSSSATTVAWVLLGASGLAGGFAGSLASRFGLRACWTGAGLGTLAGTTLLLLYPGSAVIGWTAMAVFGACYIGASGLLMIWSTTVYLQTPAFGVGTAFLVIALGQALASPLLGLMAGAFGEAAPFAAALVIGAGAIALRPRGAAADATSGKKRSTQQEFI